MLARYVESGSTDRRSYMRYRGLLRVLYDQHTEAMLLEERVEVRWREYIVITEKNRIEVEAGFAPPPGVVWLEWRCNKM
jgi:hypothetical protein